MKHLYKILFVFSLFLFPVFSYAYEMFPSYVDGNAWYIGEVGSPVGCPAGSPNKWVRYLNNVQTFVADPFICISPPWLTSISAEGLAVGDQLRFDFYNGTTLLGYINLFRGESSYYPITQIENASTTSYIVSYISPVLSPTASSTINFAFDYWNTGFEGYSFAGVEIRDVTAGYQYVPVEEAIISIGNGSYSVDYSLVEGHGHLWRPYLRSTSTTTPTLYGNWVGMIDVVSDSASSTPISAGGSFSSNTFKASLSLLSDKFPFVYYYDIYTLFSGQSFATVTPTIASGTPILQLSFPHIATTTMISKDTIRYFFPNTVASMFYNLSTVAIVLGFLLMVWRSIMNMIKVQA